MSELHKMCQALFPYISILFFKGEEKMNNLFEEKLQSSLFEW